MERKRKGLAKPKGGDLKRYFQALGSDSSSNPSTRESVNVSVQGTHQHQVDSTEEEIANFVQTEQVEEQITDSVEENVVEGITVFSPDYINGDPGLCIPLDRFAPNIRDDVRFAYIKMGVTQPTDHTFPPNRDERCFRPQWYKEFDWLEYSVYKDKAYCFCCYLFKHDRMDEKFGHDVFSKLGFDHWKNAVPAFRKHVGGACSIHNISKTSCDDFKNQGASVKSKVTTYSKDSLVKYETRVDTSLGIVSYLALQGEPFRGHDESTTSLNKGKFLELLDWVKERIPEVKLHLILLIRIKKILVRLRPTLKKNRGPPLLGCTTPEFQKLEKHAIKQTRKNLKL